jgi:formate hydrogenlyase subunit 6/NADH:ubiquinone oxidoreductase subunit I
MTWVITRVCRDCLDTSCIEVCPVDCIYEYVGPASASPRTRFGLAADTRAFRWPPTRWHDRRRNAVAHAWAQIGHNSRRHAT